MVSPPRGLLDEKPTVAEERLEPRDRLVLYTDGVVEARDTEWRGDISRLLPSQPVPS